MLTKRQIEYDHGIEGPHHDPYAYEEYEVNTINNNKEISIVFHFGLIEWIKINNKKIEGLDVNQMADLFELTTGINPSKFENYYRKLFGPFKKCPECGTKELNWSGGVAGEPIQYCTKGCGILYCSDPTPYIE